MSQTDTPEDTSAAPGGRRSRGWRNRHRGDRCRMCGQVVVVDRDGCCPLGHQVVDRAEMADRRSAMEQERATARLAEPTPGPEDGHVEIVLPEALPPTFPSAFTTASPRFADVAAQAPPQPRPPARDPLAVDPDAQATPSPRDQPAAAVTTAELPVGGVTAATLAAPFARLVGSPLARRAPATEVERCWVPGVFLTGRVMRTPVHLPERALGRHLAQPDDHVLPVMEQAPPLPDAGIAGPRIARALFEQVLDEVVDPPAPPPPAAPPVTAPPAAAVAPSPAIRVQAAPVAPVAPAQVRSAMDTGPSRGMGHRPGLDDLTPDAPSALDVRALPTVEPAPPPTYELLPLEDDTVGPRSAGTVIAAVAFLLVLVAVGSWLATSL